MKKILCFLCNKPCNGERVYQGLNIYCWHCRQFNIFIPQPNEAETFIKTADSLPKPALGI